MNKRHLWVAGALAGLFLGGCASGPKPRGLAGVGACAVGPTENQAPRPLRVLLSDAVLPEHAPNPTNEAERLVFRQLYAGLVRWDCDGKAQPDLARSWEGREAGRIWTFTLESEARFHDGSPIDAGSVRRAWTANAARPRGGAGVWAWVDPESVTVVDSRRLEVRLHRALEDAPILFAHPGLAVTGEATHRDWPSGSGPYRVASVSASRLSLEPALDDKGRPRALSPIDFALRPGDDVRDWLAEADLALTRLPAVREFAGTLGFAEADLGPTHAYVLISPRLDGAEPARMDPGLREDLVRDATGNARAPGFDLLWIPWQESPQPTETLLGTRNRIVFGPDAEARRLAERLSAVTRAGDTGATDDVLARVFPDANDTEPSAVELTSEALARAVGDGQDRAYVLALRRFDSGYATAIAGLSGAPWLAGLPVMRGVADPQALQGALAPLLETRTTVLYRGDLGPFRIDGDGTLRLEAAGGPVEPLP